MEGQQLQDAEMRVFDLDAFKALVGQDGQNLIDGHIEFADSGFDRDFPERNHTYQNFVLRILDQPARIITQFRVVIQPPE